MLQGLVALALDSGLVLFQQVFSGPCFFMSSSTYPDKKQDNLHFYLLLYATYTASKGIAISSTAGADTSGLRLVKHEGMMMFFYPNEELNLLVVVSLRTTHFVYSYEDFAPFTASFMNLLRNCGYTDPGGCNNSVALRTVKKNVHDLILAQFQMQYEFKTSVVAVYKKVAAAGSGASPRVAVREAFVVYGSSYIGNRKNCCVNIVYQGMLRLLKSSMGYSDPPRGITVAVPSYSNLTDREICRIVDDECSGKYQKQVIGDFVVISIDRGHSIWTKESSMLLLWLQLICDLEIRSHHIVQVLKL